MRAERPMVSVCIPTYNRAPMLREAIDSVLQQTFEDFELVIADNASEDGTAAMVRSWADKRIRYERSERNIGAVPNWNRCLELSRGKYVTVFHDDDLMMPTNLAEKVDVLDKNADVGMVHSRYHQIDGHGRIIKRDCSSWGVLDAAASHIEEGHRVVAALLSRNFINVSTVVIRRSCYESLGGFTDRIRYPDWEYWMRIARAYRVAFLAQPLIQWRAHEASITQKSVAQGSYDVQTAITTLEKDLEAMRWVLRTYVSIPPEKLRCRRGVWGQMADGVSAYADAMTSAAVPRRTVRWFIGRMALMYPEILTAKCVWRTYIKTFVPRRSVGQLRSISPV